MKEGMKAAEGRWKGGCVFSASSVWYVAGRCWPLRLCHIHLTQVSSSQLQHTVWTWERGRRRTVKQFRLNYRVHKRQIYRHRQENLIKMTRWSESKREMLAWCWLWVFCILGCSKSRRTGHLSLWPSRRRVWRYGRLRGVFPGWVVAGAQN